MNTLKPTIAARSSRQIMWLERFSPWLQHGPGIYTPVEAQERALTTGRLITVSSSSRHEQAVFFVQSHMFGYRVLAPSWVTVTSVFPCSGRSDLPCGRIDTVSSYLDTFFTDYTLLSSLEEVCSFLARHSLPQP